MTSANSSPIQQVVLKFEGNLEKDGFTVTLEIGEGDRRPHIEKQAQLPAAPNLVQASQEHWQEKYRHISPPYTRYLRHRPSISPPPSQTSQSRFSFDYRIKPKKTIYNGYLKRIQDCKISAQNLEKQFQAWLNTSSFVPIELALRECLKPGDNIYINIRTEEREIQKLPWHAWEFYKRYSNAEIAFSPLVSRRSPVVERSPNPKIKILAILGHQDGINIDRDREFLNSLPNAEVEFLPEPKRQAISDKLWEQPWDIIFFAGHSETEGETGKIYINPEESLELQEVWYGLRKAVERGLKLAIFNSCDGLGLAQQIDDWQIPIAIVMRELVPDRVAQEFLKYFLDRFSSGVPFHLAVREAREQLQGLEGEFPCASWLPTICQSPAESILNWQNLYQVETYQPLTIPSKNDVQPHKRQPSFTNKSILSILTVVVLGINTWVRPKSAKYFNELTHKNLNIIYNLKPEENAKRSLYWDKALFYTNIAFLLDINNGVTNNNIGRINEKMTNIERAKYFYNRAMDLENPSGCNNLGRLHIEYDEDYDSATKILIYCHDLIKHEETRFWTFKNQAWAEYEKQNYWQALDFLQQAINTDDRHYQAYCLQAIVQVELQQMDDALESASKCVNFIENPSNLLAEEHEWREESKKLLNNSQHNH